MQRIEKSQASSRFSEIPKQPVRHETLEITPVYDTAMKKMDLESSMDTSKLKHESSMTEENISEIEAETIVDKRLPPGVNVRHRANHLRKNKGQRVGDDIIKWQPTTDNAANGGIRDEEEGVEGIKRYFNCSMVQTKKTTLEYELSRLNGKV